MCSMLHGYVEAGFCDFGGISLCIDLMANINDLKAVYLFIIIILVAHVALTTYYVTYVLNLF